MLAEAEELALEVVAGRGRVVCDVSENCVQEAGAATAASAAEHCSYRGEVEDSEDLSPFDHALEAAAIYHVAAVEEGAGDAGAGDAADARDIFGVEGVRLVHLDARPCARAAPGNGDIDRRAVVPA